MKQRNILHIVVTTKDKEAWKRQAAKTGRSLSGWVRWVLNGGEAK